MHWIKFINYISFYILNFIDSSSSFYNILENNKEKEIKVEVYNLISQQKREVMLTPSEKWGGDGLLGASIRYEGSFLIKSLIRILYMFQGLEMSWDLLFKQASNIKSRYVFIEIFQIQSE